MKKLYLCLSLLFPILDLFSQPAFFPTKEGEKWYFIDYSGKKVLEPKVKASEYAPFIESYAVAKDEVTGKFGYINSSGNWAIPPQYTSANSFNKGLAVVTLPCDSKCAETGQEGLLFNGYTQVIDYTGKIILKDQAQNPSPSERYWFNRSNFNGLLCATIGSGWGDLKYLVNKQGARVSDYFHEFGERLTSGEWMALRVGGKIKYVDNQGKMVLDLGEKYAFADDFYGGYAKVTKETTIGEEQTSEVFFINKAGNIAVKIPTGYDTNSATDMGDGLYAIQKEKDSKYYYLNIEGKVVAGPYEEASKFCNGLALVRLANTYQYINLTGKVVLTPETDNGYRFGEYQKEGFAFLYDENADVPNKIVGVVLKNRMVFLLPKEVIDSTHK